MENNSIVAAPQLDNPDDLIKAWFNSRFGRFKTADDFYLFMITPSVDRDEFLRSRAAENVFCGQTLVTIYS